MPLTHSAAARGVDAWTQDAVEIKSSNTALLPSTDIQSGSGALQPIGIANVLFKMCQDVRTMSASLARIAPHRHAEFSRRASPQVQRKHRHCSFKAKDATTTGDNG